MSGPVNKLAIICRVIGDEPWNKLDDSFRWPLLPLQRYWLIDLKVDWFFFQCNKLGSGRSAGLNISIHDYRSIPSRNRCNIFVPPPPLRPPPAGPAGPAGPSSSHVSVAPLNLALISAERQDNIQISNGPCELTQRCSSPICKQLINRWISSGHHQPIRLRSLRYDWIASW